jgi:hypothetical protein
LSYRGSALALQFYRSLEAYPQVQSTHTIVSSPVVTLRNRYAPRHSVDSRRSAGGHSRR